MMEKIFDVSSKNPVILHPEEGILKTKKSVINNGLHYFPVVEDNQVLGVVTLDKLLTSHPNRIVADAMSHRYLIINYDKSIWYAKEMFNTKKADVLILVKDSNIVGIITESQIDIVLGKHICPLTGLYRNSYIYYCSSKLLKKKQEISYIFFDINKFGLIDKKYGHIIGDNILKEISILIKEALPKGAYLCRYAGDEFLIVTTFLINENILLAKNIINTIYSHTFKGNVKVTLAAGISRGKCLSESNKSINATIENLINLASLASTQAKLKKCGFFISDELAKYKNKEKMG